MRDKHVYDWKFIGLGGGSDIGFFGGSYYRGKMRIRKRSPDNWTRFYPAFVGGFGVGLSAGVDAGLKSAEGTLTAHYDWSEKSFVGRFWFYEGTLLSIKGPTGEGAADKTTVEFIGDGMLPPLSGVADSTNATGVSVGAGSAVLTGEIYATGEERDKQLELVAEQDRRIKLTSRFGARGKVHFGVDATTLSNDGRQALREMLATHLAVFRNPSTQISIEGHASPSGSARHNKELSVVRAVNVLQAMADISGEDIRVKLDNIQVSGFGEEVSAKELKDDDAESAKWRRVDIKIDGKLALTLKAPA
jgi:outer membrane protein OmpA-like peptidoglycan-associated protein